MKKFLLLLIAIATVSVLIGCKGKKEKSDTFDYDRILKGNLSDFEGNWVKENGDSMRLFKNGTTHPKQAAGNFRKTEEGVYNWNVWAEEGGGFFLALYPVNIDAINVFDNDNIIKTDNSKVRLYGGHDMPYSPSQFYYREGESPVIAETASEISDDAVADYAVTEPSDEIFFTAQLATEELMENAWIYHDEMSETYYAITPSAVVENFWWFVIDIDDEANLCLGEVKIVIPIFGEGNEKHFAVTWHSSNIPQRGVSYFISATGQRKYFYLNEDGMDGSIYLAPFTPVVK